MSSDRYRYAYGYGGGWCVALVSFWVLSEIMSNPLEAMLAQRAGHSTESLEAMLATRMIPPQSTGQAIAEADTISNPTNAMRLDEDGIRESSSSQPSSQVSIRPRLLPSIEPPTNCAACTSPFKIKHHLMQV